MKTESAYSVFQPGRADIFSEPTESQQNFKIQTLNYIFKAFFLSEKYVLSTKTYSKEIKC